jgi:hypothetical protein
MDNPSTATVSTQASPAQSSTTQATNQPSQTTSGSNEVNSTSNTPSGKDFSDVSSASQRQAQDTVNVREANKMSTLEKQATEYQTALKQQNEWILSDQTRTISYLRDQGLNDAEVQQAMGMITQQYPELWKDRTANYAEETQKTPTYEDIVNEVQTRFEMTQQVKNAQSVFFNAVPEMDPKLVSQLAPEDRQLIASFASQVDELAKTLGKVQGMGYDQALIASYNILRGRPAMGHVRQNTQQFAGMNRTNTSNSAVFNSARQGQMYSAPVNLTAQERAMADKIGMGYGDYAKWKTE